MWLLLVVLLLCGVPTLAVAQFTEPLFGVEKRTSPVTLPPAPAGTGVTRYVDADSRGGTCNNGNTGTLQSAPICSIASAITKANPGDLVYVRSRTVPTNGYNEGSFTTTRSGSAGNYITFRQYPWDPRPIINCSGSTFCWSDTWNASYWVWDGFEAKNPSQQIGVIVSGSTNAHHLWWVNSIFHDNGQAGRFGYAGFSIDANNIVFSNNEFYNIQSASVLWGFPSPRSNFLAEFNSAHDGGRDGDDEGAFKCAGNSTNCVMRYNTIWNYYSDPNSPTTCFNGSTTNCPGMSG